MGNQEDLRPAGGEDHDTNIRPGPRRRHPAAEFSETQRRARAVRDRLTEEGDWASVGTMMHTVKCHLRPEDRTALLCLDRINDLLDNLGLLLP